jgi:hypothetical protein
MRWNLRFQKATRAPVHAIEAVLVAAFGPVARTCTPWRGDARDGYSRAWELRSRGGVPALEATVQFTEASRFESSSEDPDTTSLRVTYGGAADAIAMLARWRALTAAFAELGYTDESLTYSPRTIALDLDAAGLAEEAAKLRSDVTRALVQAVPKFASVILSSQCPDDVEAVLAAYQKPREMKALSLADSGFCALPAGFARFANVEHLNVNERAFDGAKLEGWSFPKVQMLSLSGIHSAAASAAVFGTV